MAALVGHGRQGQSDGAFEGGHDTNHLARKQNLTDLTVW
jgi:hypothetical protein